MITLLKIVKVFLQFDSGIESEERPVSASKLRDETDRPTNKIKTSNVLTPYYMLMAKSSCIGCQQNTDNLRHMV